MIFLEVWANRAAKLNNRKEMSKKRRPSSSLRRGAASPEEDFEELGRQLELALENTNLASTSTADTTPKLVVGASEKKTHIESVNVDDFCQASSFFDTSENMYILISTIYYTVYDARNRVVTELGKTGILQKEFSNFSNKFFFMSKHKIVCFTAI